MVSSSELASQTGRFQKMIKNMPDPVFSERKADKDEQERHRKLNIEFTEQTLFSGTYTKSENKMNRQ